MYDAPLSHYYFPPYAMHAKSQQTGNGAGLVKGWRASMCTIDRRQTPADRPTPPSQRAST